MGFAYILTNCLSHSLDHMIMSNQRREWPCYDNSDRSQWKFFLKTNLILTSLNHQILNLLVIGAKWKMDYNSQIFTFHTFFRTQPQMQHHPFVLNSDAIWYTTMVGLIWKLASENRDPLLITITVDFARDFDVIANPEITEWTVSAAEKRF